jgi:hypothetical protein
MWEAPQYSQVMGKLVRGVNDLATLRPDLAAEWHPTKNGGLTPGDVGAGSGKKAWWLCAQGHAWEAPVNNRHRGSGCPYCSGFFVIVGESDLATMNANLALEWHPTKNGELTPRDVKSGTTKKVWWLCAQGHEWETAIGNRNAGRGCPVCANKQVLAGFNDLATTAPDVAAEWNPTKNGGLTPREVTSGSNRKAWWLCPEGHEYEASTVSRKSGSGCPYCSRFFVIVGETDLATKNPELAAEWHPTKNGGLTPGDVGASSGKKAWWLCSEGHEWEAGIASRNNGRGCPICSGRQVLPGFSDLATNNPELAAEWHPTKNGDVSPHDVMSATNKKVWWLCSEGHEWEALISSRHSGTGCPRCATSGYDQTSPGYLYLLRKEHLDFQQFGITNYPDKRLETHRRSGWERLDIIGPADGYSIRSMETALKNYFRDKGVLLPRDYPDKFDGYSESWRSDGLSFSTCAEMLEALRDWEKKI